MTNVHFIGDCEIFLESLRDRQIVMLIDQQVNKLYEEVFDGYDKIIVPQGEHSKRLALVDEIIEILVDLEFKKDSLLIGVGGGVVTDITGFVGSVYMRGISFGFLPTTLLAMCDAAIGGKNGVNAGGIKNLAGTIRQPEFVAVWPGFLKTLPEKEFCNGMAEVIKHALLDGNNFVDFLLSNAGDILNCEDKAIGEMIRRSSDFKLSVVEKDEFDNDTRHLLNFGHTIAHAIETDSGLSHGESVSVGMNADVRIAKNLGMCDDEMVKLVHQLCESFHLPTNIDFQIEELMQKITGDKKGRHDHIRYVLPVAPGDFKIIKFTVNELKKQINKIVNE